MKKKKTEIQTKRQPTLTAILASAVFSHIAARSRQFLSNPATALNILQQALQKSDYMKDQAAQTQIREDVNVLSRLVKSVLRGEYKNIPYVSLVKAFVAVVYFLFVADLVPDFIPVLGLLDDATVLTWVISSIRMDLDRFTQWEVNNYRGKTLPEATGNE